jgi:putative ABC transport system permease protein
MHALVHDVRDAVRLLLKQPRFLVIASLTLALGLGAVAAIFSVVNGVLLKPLPYAHADRLVAIGSSAPGLGYDRFPLSPDMFVFYQKHNAVFEDMAILQPRLVNLTRTGSPEVIEALVASHSYFSTLGIPFALGRPYSAAEDRDDAPRVAVMSHRLWSRQFGSDAGVIGTPLSLDGEPTTIVGVAPAWLDEARSPDLWLPTRFNPASPPTGNFGWNAFGRLRGGVGPDDAVGNLAPLVQRAMSEAITSDTYRAFLREGGYRPTVRPMKEEIVGGAREPLLILFGTVLIVLLVACGNVANLCLVRGEARQRELAVRQALGGSRGGLVRKLMVEAFVLAGVGAALAIAIAAIAVPALVRIAPPTIPRVDEIRLEPVVVLVVLAAAVVAALLFGLAPALRYTRGNVLSALRQGGRSSTDHPGRHRGRNLLVVAQTAMALMLLVGSGLLARSFQKLMTAEAGYSAANVMTFRVTAPAQRYPKAADSAAFAQRLIDRLGELPGVEVSGAVSELPTNGPSGTAFEFRDKPSEPGRLPPMVQYQIVGGRYFEAMRIPIARGRDFDSSDRRDPVYSVIVNEAAAAQYWPGQDPVGKELRQHNSDPKEQLPWSRVVGVVRSIRQNNLREQPRPLIYFPLNEGDRNPVRSLSYVIRGPQALASGEAIRRTVLALDPDMPLTSLEPLAAVLERSVVQFSFTMLTLAIAAGIALLLGAIGLYGVLSYAVSLRTREIGVRLALGAQTSAVMRSVVANGAAIVAIGLVIGLAGAALATRLLSGLLYDTAPLDLATFVTMPAVLFVVALVAAYLPARRAAAVSPIEAMRGE